jgi:Flp pilus assembly pilin Flp
MSHRPWRIDTRSWFEDYREKVEMRRVFAHWLRDESGQDLIEYALLTAFISLVCTALINSIGTVVNSWYEGYGSTIATIPGGSGS